MATPDAVFKALADPTRREILHLLRSGSRSSGEIADRFPVAWATISRHLAVLRDAELVTAERNEETRRKELTTFTYDTSRCMFCGLCEDACPVDALELTQDFELAYYTREGAIWDRQMLEEGPLPTQYKF